MIDRIVFITDIEATPRFTGVAGGTQFDTMPTVSTVYNKYPKQGE